MYLHLSIMPSAIKVPTVRIIYAHHAITMTVTLKMRAILCSLCQRQVHKVMTVHSQPLSLIVFGRAENLKQIKKALAELLTV